MRKIRLSIIICTYKREQYVLKNIDLLNKECRDFIYKVFVIDNGKTLDTKLSNGFINIIPNKNLGGSGGYARGMYEAHKESKSTHIMLMDDDIEFTPDVLKKAISRLSNFNNEQKDDWIGFGMVTFDNPNQLFECGAYWNGIKLKSNYKGTKLCDFKCKNIKYNYSAWWSLIMPLSVVDRYGYPLPFFIKYDDIEYGLRRKNEKIHFYGDLYIKHENFQNKKTSIGEYYLTRNSFVTNFLHLPHYLSKSICRFLLKCIKMYFCFDYKSLIMANKGMEDFLKGSTIFLNNVVENNNQIKLFNENCRNRYFVSLIVLPFLTFANVIKLIFSHKKLYSDYKATFNKMTHENNWADILDINRSDNK